MAEPGADRLVAPAQVLDPLLAFAPAVALRQRQQGLGRLRIAVEHHVFDRLTQLGIQGVVERQRACIDDAHVHAGLDRVVQKHHVDRLADQLVAAE